MQGAPVLHENSSGSLFATFNETSDSYLDSFSGALSGKVDLLLVEGEARIEYASRVARTTHSTSYSYRFSAELGTFVLEDRSLTALGRTATTVDDAGRRALCGDTFVSATKMGAEFYLSATFELANRDELERFVATVEVTALFGMVSGSKSWSSETHGFARRGYVRIEPFQRGGDPSLLERIVANGTTVCRFDNVGPCQELLSQLSRYARSLDQPGLREQLRDPDTWEVLEISSTPYGQAGHDRLGVGPASESLIPRIVRELVTELNHRTSLVDRADFLAEHVFNDTDDVDMQLSAQMLSKEIRISIGALQNVLNVCRATSIDSECAEAYSLWKSTRHVVEDSLLNIPDDTIIEES